MSSNEIPITTWTELHEALYASSWKEPLGRFRSSFAFRGHAHADYSLRTSLSRLGGTGGELERHWGGRRYLAYYLVCGVGAGLLVTAQALLRGDPRALLTPTVGASGAIYGLILAYGVIFADRIVLFMMLFPMKARTMTWILFAIAFLSNLSQSPDGLSHIAHLGGMVVGWVYLKKAWRLGELAREIRWKIRRRKFKVMPPNDDRWVH